MTWPRVLIECGRKSDKSKKPSIKVARVWHMPAVPSRNLIVIHLSIPTSTTISLCHVCGVSFKSEPGPLRLSNSIECR